MADASRKQGRFRHNSGKPFLETLKRHKGAIRDFSAPEDVHQLASGDPDRPETISLDMGTAYVRKSPFLSAEDSFSLVDYTGANVYSNRSAIYRNDWKHKSTNSGCFVDVFGRDQAGRSTVVTVEFSPSVTIEFIDDVPVVTRPKNAVRNLRDLMVKTAVKRSLRTPKYRSMKLARRKDAIKHLETYWSEQVSYMRMDPVVTMAHRGYGFFPDTKSAEPALAKFPVLTIFFSCEYHANLLSETLYLEEKGALLGWRRANERTRVLLDFIVRSGIESSGNFEIPLRKLTPNKRCYFHTDREFSMTFDPIKHLASDTFIRNPADSYRIAHKVLLSFDLEAVDPKFGFPNAKKLNNQTVCISATIYNTTTKKWRYVMLSLSGVSEERIMDKTRAEGGESDIEAPELRQFATEPELWEGLRDLIIEVDADIIFGWNSDNFDWKYGWDRFQNHWPEKVLTSRFFNMSRIIGHRCHFVEREVTTSAHGTRTTKKPVVPGRQIADIMVFVSKKFKFAFNSLAFVSSELLGEDSTKTHFAPEDMMRAWLSGDPVQRRRVNLYCLQDTILPIMIWNKLQLLERSVMEARVTSATQDAVLSGGELVKSYSLLYRLACERGYVLNRNPADPPRPPTRRLEKLEQGKRERCSALIQRDLLKVAEELKIIRTRLKKSRDPDYTCKKEAADQAKRKSLVLKEKQLRESLKSTKYEGAIVLEVKKGLWYSVFTVDFKSLYPSIMIRHNVDTSALVTREEYANLPNWDYKRTVLGADGKETLLAQNILGLMPLAAKELLAARGLAKKEMQVAKKLGNHSLAAVLDGKQMALKVTCNSLYGSYGVNWEIGNYVDRSLARTVTAVGRGLIERTRDIIHEKWGHSPHDATVIMGDTDSCFAALNRDTYPNTLEGRTRAMEVATEVATTCNDEFGHPIILEVEKLYESILVQEKKRYSGHKRERAEEKEAVLDAKGDMSVRRDAAPVEKEIFVPVQQQLLKHHDIDGAVQLLIGGLQQMLDGKIELDKYVRTCALKPSYLTRTPQGCARDRMEGRQRGSAPASGSRIRFVFTFPKGSTNDTKLYDLAEHVDYVRDPVNKLGADVYTYVCHMRNAVVGLFEGFQQMERVHRIFDQAEDISLRRRLGQTVIDPVTNTIKDVPDAVDAIEPQLKRKKSKKKAPRAESMDVDEEKDQKQEENSDQPCPVKMSRNKLKRKRKVDKATAERKKNIRNEHNQQQAQFMDQWFGKTN